MSKDMEQAMESRYVTTEDLGDVGTLTAKVKSVEWQDKTIKLRNGESKDIRVLVLTVPVAGKDKIHECNMTETRLIGKSGTDGKADGDDLLPGKRVRFGVVPIPGDKEGKTVVRINKVLA